MVYGAGFMPAYSYTRFYYKDIMQVVEQSAIIEIYQDPLSMVKKLELIGRTCYASQDKITETSYKTFLHNVIKRGHLSVIEHAYATAHFITDRGIANEIVRHRIASFCQQSTRYVKYDNISIIKPSGILYGTKEWNTWMRSVIAAESHYQALIENGVAPQVARSVLPTCTATELYMTANLREWRHFIELRSAQGAHPDIISLSNSVLKQLSVIPVIFDDLVEKYLPKESLK